MKRAALLLLPLLLLSLAAYFALAPDAAGPGPTGLDRDAATPPAAAATGERAAADSARLEPGVSEASARREAEPESGQAPAIPADAEWIEVTVVDRDTEAPIADAEVFWHDQAIYMRPELTDEDRMRMWRDPERTARQYGFRTRSDAQGRARITLDENTMACARQGSRYGTLHINRGTPPPPEGHCISLAADRSLHVQVRTADDQPAAGVDVEIAAHDQDGKFLRMLGWGVTARSEAPDGIATFTHLQTWLHYDRRENRGTPAGSFRARVRVPGFTDPGVPLAAELAEDAPVVLHLPACGSVRVRVELRGEPIGGRPASLAPEGEGDENRTTRRQPDADGWTRFPFVPLGQRLVANAQCDESVLTQKLVGPRTGGEEVTVALPVPADYVLARFRLLDHDRQPLGKQRFTVTWRWNNRMRGFGCRTDDDGRCLLFLGPAKGGSRLDQFRVEQQERGREPLRATLPPRDLGLGVQDLGDLVLTQPPLLVGGRFCHGELPFTGNIGCQVERLLAQRDQEGRERWDSVEGLSMQHDRKAGTFAFRGEAPPDRLRLSFWAYENLPIAPLEFRAGTTDLVVQVDPGAALVATLLLPDDFPGGLTARLQPEPGTPALKGDDHTWRLQSQPDHQEGRRSHLRWQSLPAGSYALQLRLQGDPLPLLQLAGIAVPPPEGGDERLRAIDLRTQLEVLTLVALGNNGKPATGGGSAYLLPVAESDAEPFDFEQGQCRIGVRAGAHDVLVGIGGFRPQELRGVRGRVELPLQPWPLVELSFVTPPLPEGHTLLVSLKPVADDPTNWSPTWPPLRLVRGRSFQPRANNVEVRDLRASLPIGDGRSQLTVQVRRQRNGNSQNVTAAPTQLAAGTTAATVQVTAEALTKVLAGLDQQEQREQQGRGKRKGQ